MIDLHQRKPTPALFSQSIVLMTPPRFLHSAPVPLKRLKTTRSTPRPPHRRSFRLVTSKPPFPVHPFADIKLRRRPGSPRMQHRAGRPSKTTNDALHHRPTFCRGRLTGHTSPVRLTDSSRTLAPLLHRSRRGRSGPSSMNRADPATSDPAPQLAVGFRRLSRSFSSS